MKNFKDRKTHSKLFKALVLGNRGQGLVEFILMIVIIILLVLGLAYQFNDAFRVYASNYFGEYLSCLIETGELPSLGSTGGAAGICNSQFAEFSIENGRPLIGDGITAGAGSGGAGAGDDGADKGNSKSFTGSGGTAGSNSSYGSGSSGNNRFKVGRSGKNSGGASGGSSSNRMKSKRNSQGGDDFGAINSEGDRVIIIKRKRYGSIGTYDADAEEQKEEREKPIRAQDEDMKRTGSGEKVLIKIDQKKKKNELPEFDEEFSFGDFFRYLIIIAIIIALVVFFGGQVVRISKSMDAE